MDDMERYGDYNEIDTPPSKSRVLFFLKVIVIFAILAVVIILGVRIFLYNYYPDSMKAIYVDEKLKEHYSASGGNIDAKTQELRIPYDDPKTGAFFCDNLIAIDSMGRVQINIRYNTSTMEYLEQKYKLSGLDPTDEELFTFVLYKHDEGAKVEFSDENAVGTPISRDFCTYAMYGCYRLVFDNVPLAEDSPCCLILAVYVNGVEDTEPYAAIRIYENNDEYSDFESVGVKESDLKK